jgi:hypothetical protein
VKNHTERDEMEIEEKVWKTALVIGIKDFADDLGLSFGDIHTFFCEFVCLNLSDDTDEEDARELCKMFYQMMLKGIEMRKEQQ